MSTRRYSQEQRQKTLLARIAQDIPASVQLALREDLGGIVDAHQDITALLLPDNETVSARIITREAGIFCGARWLEEVFSQLGNTTTIVWHVADGDAIPPTKRYVRLRGQPSSF